MGKIAIGVHARRLRLELSLQSEDVDTHSLMGDQKDFFDRLLDRLQDVAIREINAYLPEGPKR